MLWQSNLKQVRKTVGLGIPTLSYWHDTWCTLFGTCLWMKQNLLITWILSRILGTLRDVSCFAPSTERIVKTEEKPFSKSTKIACSNGDSILPDTDPVQYQVRIISDTYFFSFFKVFNQKYSISTAWGHTFLLHNPWVRRMKDQGYDFCLKDGLQREGMEHLDESRFESIHCEYKRYVDYQKRGYPFSWKL